MNVTTPDTSTEGPIVRASSSSERPRRRRRTALALVATAIVATGVGVGVTGTLNTDGTRTSRTGVVDNADPTSLATVTRQDLSSQTSVNATLGYAGSYSVVNQVQGTITAVPRWARLSPKARSSTRSTVVPSSFSMGQRRAIALCQKGPTRLT